MSCDISHERFVSRLLGHGFRPYDDEGEYWSIPVVGRPVVRLNQSSGASLRELLALALAQVVKPAKRRRSAHWLDVADLERFYGLGWVGPHEWASTLGRGKARHAWERKWERFKIWLINENVPHEKRWDESERDCDVNTGSVSGVVKIRLTEDTLSYLGMTDTHDEFVERFDLDRYFCVEHWVSTAAQHEFAAVA